MVLYAVPLELKNYTFNTTDISSLWDLSVLKKSQRDEILVENISNK